MRQSSIISYDLNLVILEREWISYCRQQSSGAPYTSLTPPPHCTTSGPSPGCGLEARSRDGLGEGRRGSGETSSASLTSRHGDAATQSAGAGSLSAGGCR